MTENSVFTGVATALITPLTEDGVDYDAFGKVIDWQIGEGVQALVIAGTRDMIKEAHTRLIAESIPDARLVFVKGDHFIANRNPAEFNRAVLDFLQS